MDSINSLNSKLERMQVPEALRSQFVGTLLMSLNNGLMRHFYTNDESCPETKTLLTKIAFILKEKIKEGSSSIDKWDNDIDEEQDEQSNITIKTNLLIANLKNASIKRIRISEFRELLDEIQRDLIPRIDTTTSKGEDLLNLFFTTFNKYVGREDKNQAFTPPHITDFMCELIQLNENSRVLDPTCGSGSFLVQAMSKMLAKVDHVLMKDADKIRRSIKSKQLFGIEKDENVFGLATTNMLIHQDGKSNVVLDSCFEREQ